MKKIDKALLDANITITRKYWDVSKNSVDYISEKMALSKALSESCGIEWLAIQNFLDGILKRTGFKKNATNEEIYECIRLLGYEIVEQYSEE